MTHWLDLAERALEDAPGPVDFFFRDDDGGWGDAELLALLDVFEARGVPIDVAVIPDSCGKSLARSLNGRMERTGGSLGLHQHGFRHVNHETQGRKCEFGSIRSEAQQTADILGGRERLQDAFGTALDPIFTPPWNRCSQSTANVLALAGYRLLSRDVTAKPLDLKGVGELPVAVDWCKWTKQADGLVIIGGEIARFIAKGGPVGIMLHHAVMTAQELDELDSLLSLLTNHLMVHCKKMNSTQCAA